MSIPTVEHNGVAASDMRRLQRKPLFGLDSISFGGGNVLIGGLALRMIDGRAPRFIGEPGVKFEVSYGLPNPAAADFYWYWPESGASAYRIVIDLAETRHDGPAYMFRVAYPIDEPGEDLRTTFVVPKNMSTLQNFPSQASLKRVQRFETIGSVALKGYTDAWRFLSIAKRHGWTPGPTLDWGCGHGRVVRHLRAFGVPEAWGVDIDPENIGWAKERLPGVDFRVGPLMPPTDYEDGQFSLVYGLSVMTHLAKSVQQAWLEEIARILKPGGIALLTFAGDAAVAFSSRYVDRSWMDTYFATGFGPELPDQSLVGVIEDHEYYKNINQTAAKAAEICTDYLAVEAVYESMFGYQDLLVLRKA